MEIKKAENRHIGQISRLYQEFFSYNAAHQPVYYKDADETGRYPAFIIASPSDELFVAEEGERVLGLLHVCHDKTAPFDCIVQYKFAVITDLYVVPGFRRQGIATRLIDEARLWAKACGCSYIELMVLSENDGAIRLYQRQGLKTVSHTMRSML